MDAINRPELPATWPRWPTYGTIDDLLPSLAQWSAQKKRAALATLVEITGSSPRPLGSEMVIAENGDVAGYVSGGCVEAAVALEGLASIADGQARVLDYGAGSPIVDIQLTCGGRIGILVRPIVDLAGYVSHRYAARRARHVLNVVSDMETGAMRFIEGEAKAGPGEFVRVHTPLTRLVAVGGDPVTLALLSMARNFNFELGLLRPLGPEQAPEGFDLGFYDRRRLETALADLALDRWSAVYSLTHDAQADLRVAHHALASEAFCVGVLGSRRKIAARVKALRDAGVSEKALKRLHLPAGIDIAARTPQEIALSILAQIVAARSDSAP
ncbi:XdhC family protein [Kozakia baliensis]|uniref:XdhC family protein n=1 Tax=Kozakia baliensis TaxID=153496 RepID=UPI000496F706|nr:XdhC family protein [Kozakia baliensis]